MTHLIANLLLSMLLTGGTPPSQGPARIDAQRTPVEISVDGDDVWSRGLRRAVRRQFRAMREFRLVEESTSPEALTIIILQHFQGPQGDGSERVTYSLRIRRGTRVGGLPGGACDTEHLEVCARQIGLAVHSARDWPNPAQ
jgi:hypothetical protein